MCCVAMELVASTCVILNTDNEKVERGKEQVEGLTSSKNQWGASGMGGHTPAPTHFTLCN